MRSKRIGLEDMNASTTATKNHMPGGGHDIISYQKELSNHTEHIQVDTKSQKEIPEPQNFIQRRRACTQS